MCKTFLGERSPLLIVCLKYCITREKSNKKTSGKGKKPGRRIHLLLFEYVIRADERKRQEDLIFTWVIESYL